MRLSSQSNVIIFTEELLTKKWHFRAPLFQLLSDSLPFPRIYTNGRSLARSYGDVMPKFCRLHGFTKIPYPQRLCRFALWNSFSKLFNLFATQETRRSMGQFAFCSGL